MVTQVSDVFFPAGVQLRLVGGGLSYGRLEASLGGQLWGSVSCDGFDDSCAFTFCRQLGYDFGRQRKAAGTHVSRSGDVFLQFKKGCSSGKKRLLDETPRSAWGNVVKAGWCGVGVSLYCLQNDTGKMAWSGRVYFRMAQVRWCGVGVSTVFRMAQV